MRKFVRKMVDNPKVKTKVITGIGIGFGLTTCYLVSRQAPKVSILMEDRRNDLDVEELTKFEEIKVRLKAYALPIATGVAACTCFVLSDYIAGVRLAEMGAAAVAAENALLEYQMRPSIIDDAKTVLVGQTAEEIKERREKRKKAIESNAELKEKIKNNPNTLITFVDCQSNQVFHATYADVRDAVQDINDMLLEGEFVSVNDFYDSLNESLGQNALNHIDGGYERGFDYRFDGRLMPDYQTTIDYDGKYVEKGEIYCMLKYEASPLCSSR